MNICDKNCKKKFCEKTSEKTFCEKICEKNFVKKICEKITACFFLNKLIMQHFLRKNGINRHEAANNSGVACHACDSELIAGNVGQVVPYQVETAFLFCGHFTN